MGQSKDKLYSFKTEDGFGDWTEDYDEELESIHFLGELCNEKRKLDIDDYLYEEYKESERMEDEEF